MTGPTHRQYAICFACLANIALYIYGITEINYYLALMIMLQMSKMGALFPDVDHNWANVKEKTVPNWIINKLIHLTGGKHRSWQTHSIDIVAWFVFLSFMLPKYLFMNKMISITNREVLSIIMLGFSSGWVSHIISDMLTSAGAKPICFLPNKIAFVPSHIGSIRFNTGNGWEAFCFRTTKILNIFIGVFTLMYPFIANGTITNLVSKVLSNI